MKDYVTRKRTRRKSSHDEKEKSRLSFFPSIFMETMSSSSSLSNPDHDEPSSTDDELSMHQTLLFSDSLKELKNLRTQLYSAAEYFELSYNNDEQKQKVMDTLKDYVVRALVNTVDHLGTITYKVNGMLDERVINQVSGTELGLSCIEQKLRTCQNHIDHEGLSQQSLMITTPKHHKRYILPVGETMRGSGRTRHQCCSLDDEDHWHQFKNAIRSTIRETTQSTSISKGISQSPSPQRSNRPGTFSFTEKQLISEKRTVSPSRPRIPLIRSDSFSSMPSTASRSSTPNRPTTQSSPSAIHHRSSSENWKSASMRLHGERDNRQDIESHLSKSKRVLKELLSRHTSKKDEALYTFLDEY